MAKLPDFSQYPHIQKYSNLYGESLSALAQGYELEAHYHEVLMKEKSASKREAVYSEFYSKLMFIYGREKADTETYVTKIKYVNLFEKELSNKSVIDFGCGQGHMLQAIKKELGNDELMGVDVFIPKGLKYNTTIKFEEKSIINYRTKNKFQIAISDNVIEHLVKDDAATHMASVYDSLEDNGKLILMMPNRLFGPSDVTRIIDFSQSGNTQALGGHVNESTYTEMIAELKRVGFTQFYTVIPIPKLKYSLFKNIRLTTGWITRIEKSKFLLKVFRAIKIKGVCPIRFTLTLIAVK
mgnify:CR=1 FL=1